MADPKDLHRRALEHFGELVRSVRDDQWSSQTPCDGWDVRTLVNHLTAENLWMPPLLAGGTIAEVGSALDGDVLGEDPKRAWDDSAAGAARAVAEVRLDRTVHLSYGDVPARHYVNEVFTDLAIHGWDLARGIGADETIDPEFVELIYAHAAPHERDMKASGLFGPTVTPPEGADLQTRLLAVFGRVA